MNNDEAQESAVESENAIDLLKADHQQVKEMFDQFERTRDTASDVEKGELVKAIGNELAAHESVENEVFFPAVKQVLRKDQTLAEATADQEDAGEAIQALQDLTPGEVGFDDKVSALGAQVAAHAQEEEQEVFPKVQQSEIDTDELGKKMQAHKDELEHGAEHAPS